MLTAADPLTPDWWVERLVTKIIMRQSRYDRLEDYFLGDHDFPQSDTRYVQAIRKFQEISRTNYSSLVTLAPVERMQVTGFRFGNVDQADAAAARMWSVNELDFQSTLLHLMCSVFGDAYAIVAPPGEPGGDPVITVEDPRYCAVEMDPSRPGRVMAAFKMWEDPISNRILGVLWMPDGRYLYEGPALVDVLDLDEVTLTHRLVGGTPHSFRGVGFQPDDIGVVPVVRFSWQATFGDMAQGEAESVLGIQDRINNEIMNRLVISRSQAYKQRLITGVKLADDKRRGKRPPFDPGADMLWAVQDPNARMFEFKEADIKQLLEAVRDDVGDMAAISKTPPHYLLGEVVNVSGDALKAAETGLVSKVRQRMRTMGPCWERVIRLGFLYLGDSRGKEMVANVIWADPESKSRAELADAMGKEIAAGVPLQLAMARAGFTPEEIAFAVAEKRKNEARQAALQAAAAGATARGSEQGQQAEKPAKGTEEAGGTPTPTR